MGWKDGTPDGQQPPASSTQVAPPSTAQSVPAAAPATGWRAGQPDQTAGSSAPAPSSPAASSVPWFSTGPGSDKIGEFFAKAGDAATFGLGAKAQDALGIAQGPNGQTVAQQVGAAGQDIGPVASAGADLLGYAAGPGMVGVGDRLAGLMGGRLLARMGGSAAEGAGASALGTAGHGDMSVGDLLKAAALGGTVGAVTGALPGGGGDRPVTPSTAALKTIKEDAFAPLEKTPVNAPLVDAAFNGVSQSSGANVNLSDAFKNKVADIEKEVTGTQSGLTAGDIANYNRALWGKARNGFDQNAAGQYESALNSVVGPSTAYDIKAANAAHNTYKTSGEIDNWLTDPSGAPSAIASRLAKKPGFYQNQLGLYDALNSIAQSQPGLLSKMTGKVGAGLAGAAINAAGEYIGGQNPITGAITGGLEGLVLGHAANQLRAAPIRAKLLAAQHLNATGMPAPVTRPILGPLGDFARTAGYAGGASGAF